MNTGKILYEPREIETEPLEREILVHRSMLYHCENCGNIYKFWLEKGLEDKKQDEINPQGHKPVPFCIGCLCGGIMKHSFWGHDEQLEDYRPLEESENYFENKETEEHGISHFRNSGNTIMREQNPLEDLRKMQDRIIEESEKRRQERLKREKEAFLEDPYGLAHISTTTLKKELRRRKGC